MLKGVKVEDRAVEEIKRHFDVVAESLKDEIKLIAEGHILLNKKIDDLGEGVDDLRKENAEEHALINKRIDDFRKENAEDHAVLKKKIDDVRRDIEKRVSQLENLR